MGAMKALMSKDTIQKMTWLTYGNQLNTYIGDDVPKEYGGSSVSLKEIGVTPKYDEPAKETNGTMAKDTSSEATKDAAHEAGKESSIESPKESSGDATA